MAHAAKSRIGRYESVYDLEEACFRHYRVKIKSSLQTTGNISAEHWGRNHALNRDEAIRGFDQNCGHFRKQDLVRNARASLLKRIETENMELIKLYELRIMNEAMQESLRESRAMTEESRATVNKLNVVREEQNKTLDENNARIAKLSSQQSNAREQYSKNSKALADVENYMAQLESQRQEQEREQRELEEQARKNAERLEELERLSEKKKKSRFKLPSMPWPFGSSKPADANRPQNTRPYSEYGTNDSPYYQRSTPYPKHDQQTTNTQYHHHPANSARGPPVVVGSYEQQGFEPTPAHKDISVGPNEFPIDKSHTQLRGDGNFDTQTSPQSQGNDPFHNTSVTRNPTTYVKEAGTDSIPEPNGENAVNPSLLQNDKFHSTSIAINPPTTVVGTGADSKPKRDYKSSVIISPISADHTDNVENNFGAMSTRDGTCSSSGMKSNYDRAFEESYKIREQFAEPYPSQANTDTFAENHDTRNQMQKNNNSSSQGIVTQVNFNGSYNQENVTKNSPATVIETSQEVPERASKDVGNLINLDTERNVNSNTIDGNVTTDLLSTQTPHELPAIKFEDSDKSRNSENITHNSTATLIDKSQEVPESESKDSGDLISLDIEATVNSNTTIGRFDSLSTQTQQELSLIGFETSPETISLNENVHDSENEMAPVDNNLLPPEGKLPAESTTGIQPITNDKSLKIFNVLAETMKNSLTLLPANNKQSDQDFTTNATAQSENADGLNQQDDNIPLTQNKCVENSSNEAEEMRFITVNMI